MESSLIELSSEELDAGWQQFDEDFRKHYVVFGPTSGSEIESLESLRRARDLLPPGAAAKRPDSFIGFRFGEIQRVVFYAVMAHDFAEYEEYLPQTGGSWKKVLRVP